MHFIDENSLNILTNFWHFCKKNSRIKRVSYHNELNPNTFAVKKRKSITFSKKSEQQRAFSRKPKSEPMYANQKAPINKLPKQCKWVANTRIKA